MVANVLRIEVEAGAEVRSGDTLMLLESMKMEIPVIAEADGRVSSVLVAPGTVVQEGDVLMELESR